MRMKVAVTAVAAFVSVVVLATPSSAADYFSEAPVTSIAVSADGKSLSITPATLRPVVLCPETYSTATECLNASAHVFKLPDAAISTLSIEVGATLSALVNRQRQDVQLQAGKYLVWVDNSKTRSPQPAESDFFGPVKVTVGGPAPVATPSPSATPTVIAAPTAVCTGTQVVPFAKTAKGVSAADAKKVASFAAASCSYVVTGYANAKSAGATALSLARATAVAATIKKANPAATVTVKNGGKTTNKSCTKQSNNCAVVARG